MMIRHDHGSFHNDDPYDNDLGHHNDFFDHHNDLLDHHNDLLDHHRHHDDDNQ